MRLRATKLNAIGNRRSGAWTPAALGSSLALWLDAEDASKITLNGSTVSQWQDKSGNNRHATQSTAANQPTYTTNGLNGKPVVTFDGSSDFMNVTSFNQAVSLAIMGSGGTITSPLVSGAAPSNFAPAWNANADLVAYRAQSTSTISNVTLGGLSTNFAIGFVSVNISAGSVGISGNGAALTAFPQSLNTADTTINTIGRDYGGVDQFSNGSIAELIVASTVLNLADRQRLEGYLAWKWSGLLP